MPACRPSKRLSPSRTAIRNPIWRVRIAGLLLTGAAVFLARPSVTNAAAATPRVLRVVAAENFYGNIATQLGGDHVQVRSIISDPNVDPHEYESSVPDAAAIANANVVIRNGLEYDTWIDKLLTASPSPHRVVLTAGRLAPRPLPDNPHVWYGVDNVAAIAKAITKTYERLDPPDADKFKYRLAAFEQSLAPIRAELARIKAKFAGTPVGLTETIDLYQTEPAGLNVLTPFTFEKAIAEGNDPPMSSVVIANQQVDHKQIKILIYNFQTVTALTTHMLERAQKLGIPIVPVWETMRSGDNYQSWMLIQLNHMEQALEKATHG